jgi:hypothetical protein
MITTDIGLGVTRLRRRLRDTVICEILAETEEIVAHRAHNTTWCIRMTAVRCTVTPHSLLCE